MLLESAMKRLEDAAVLDRPARSLAAAVSSAASPRPVKNGLSGSWLGHRLHPALVPAPLGFWAGALVFDGIGTQPARYAADVLVGAGVVTALLTAAAGLSDWADTYGPAQRVGLVHAVCNTAALACYTASLVARALGRRKSGVALSLMGAGAVSLGGYLGGHLSYVLATGVERKGFYGPGPEEWTPVLAADELPQRQPRLVRAGEVDVVLYRDGDRVHALAARCNHEGGPLHEGTFQDGCVICPWHGSTFRLRDGAVVRAPAAASQPVYETRVSNGKLEVRAS